MKSVRNVAGALAMATLVAGCPALVFDPPYRAVAEDASIANDSGARLDTGPTVADAASQEAAVGDEAALASDAMSPGDDGGPPEAAPGDGAAPYDSGCPGVICNGVCMAGIADCSKCSGNTSLCLSTGTCQADCSGCGGVSCLMCADGGAPTGAAMACGAGCLSGLYPHCACTAAAACGVTNQTCTNGACTTCGESSTDTQPCFSVGKCSPGARPPVCFKSSSACSCM